MANKGSIKKDSSMKGPSVAESKSKLIFMILFVGYATYTLNRKGVSLVLPKLIGEGLHKSDAGKCENVCVFDTFFTESMVQQV